jgi:hypothetical protein
MMHVFQYDAHEWTCGDRNDVHYCSHETLYGYKYLIHLTLITISHYFTFSLRVFSLLLLATMEDKRESKSSCSPFKEGSSPPSSVSTPLPVTSGSPPPPGSHSEVSSRHPCQLVLEQGGPSKKISVVDLSSSSDEEDLILDITRGAEFTKNYLATSTMSSLDHSSTARSSSSMTPMRKKRRCARRMPKPR